MRHLLTALGILLAIVLLGAMTVPYFVNFAQYRAQIETQITEMTGHKASIDGPITIRLLPTPSISMRQVKLGPADANGFRMFEAERIYGALAATSLLRGEFQITEANIDAPILRIGEKGFEGVVRPGTASPSGAPPAISIEKLLIRDGTAVIARKNREALTISEFNGEIEASSLIGPAKGNGSFVVEGAKRQIRFAVGRIEAGKARVKALLEDVQLAMRFDIDGIAAVGEDASERFDGHIGLVGNTTMSRQDKVQIPLRINSKAKLNGPLLTLSELTAVIGPEPQPLTLTGNGTIRLEARPVYDVTLSARSYDFDRVGADGAPRKVVPAELIRQATALVPQGSGSSGITGRFDLSAGALIIGGQTVIGPHVVVEQSEAGGSIVRLDGELPGQSRVVFDRSGPASAGLLSGVARFDSRDPEKLHGWFYGVARVATAAASIKASANLGSIKDGVTIQNLAIERGETRLSGAGRYMLQVPGVRPAPQLSLTLTSPRLHVGDLPAFIVNPDKREEKPDLDFDLDITADRIALDGRDSGRFLAKLRRDGAITSIERIEIAGLDGASLIASGTLGGGARRVTIKIDADRAEGIAAVAEHVFPSPLTEGLRRRAQSLSPALIVATLANDEVEDTYDLTADGQLGGSEIKANGKLVAKADIFIDLAFALKNPDSGRMAQQLSGTRRALTSMQPASLSFSVKGNPRAAMDVAINGALLGVDGDVRGTIKLFQPFVPFEGLISVRAADLFPPLGALGIDQAFLTRGAKGTLAGKVESNLQKITITDMRLQLGDVPLTGEIAFKIAEGGAVAGQIKLPEIDLRPALALAFGNMPGLMGANGWTTTPFLPAMPAPLQGDIWVEAERGRIDGRLTVNAPRFVLRFGDGLFSFEHGSLQLGAAKITGDFAARRTGPGVFVSSKLAFAGLDADKLYPGGAKGIGDGEIQFSANGDSMAKLAQTGAGSGRLRVAGLNIPGFDGTALSRLIATPLSQLGAADAKAISTRLEAELAKGALTAPELRFPMVVIDGNLRFGSAKFDQAGITHELSGSYDLGRLTGDFRIASAIKDTLSMWRGPPPMFIAQWRGAIGSLQRSLAVEQLVNGFLALTLQRDAEKAEIQEQDLRERSYFNRRLKAMEFEKKRSEEERLEAARVEQARVAEEERQRRQKLAEEAAARRRQAAEEAARQRQAIDQPASPELPVPPPVVGPPVDLTRPLP